MRDKGERSEAGDNLGYLPFHFYPPFQPSSMKKSTRVRVLTSSWICTVGINTFTTSGIDDDGRHRFVSR